VTLSPGGLSPEEEAALIHWSSYGRPGGPTTSRFVPEDRSKLHDFIAPESAPWNQVFDEEQTLRLLRGFEPEVMEDKWAVYSDGLTVHFHRSWTGAQIVQLELELTETGSRAVRGTWETDAATLKGGSEEFARTTFAEVCRWVLGMTPAA
jgi:hypothetical protein